MAGREAERAAAVADERRHASDTPWEEYLAAARRLDALRRGAATAEDDPSRATTATFEELTRVRARLAAQHVRLRTLGVPEEELQPSAADVTTASLAVPPVSAADPAGAGPGARPADDPGDMFSAEGPGTVWTALRRARTLAEEADTALAPPGVWSALTRWGRAIFSRRPRRS